MLRRNVQVPESLAAHLLLVACSDSFVRGFDLRSSPTLPVLTLPLSGGAADGGAESVGAGPQDGQCVVGSGQGVISLFDIRQRRYVALLGVGWSLPCLCRSPLSYTS
jgi:WD40 repeat protein